MDGPSPTKAITAITAATASAAASATTSAAPSAASPMHVGADGRHDASLRTIIDEELMCGICREVMVRPVWLRCGHMFCRSCNDYWFSMSEKTACAVCKQHHGRGKIVLVRATDELVGRFIASAAYTRQEQAFYAKRSQESDDAHMAREMGIASGRQENVELDEEDDQLESESAAESESDDSSDEEWKSDGAEDDEDNEDDNDDDDGNDDHHHEGDDDHDGSVEQLPAAGSKRKRASSPRAAPHVPRKQQTRAALRHAGSFTAAHVRDTGARVANVSMHPPRSALAPLVPPLSPPFHHDALTAAFVEASRQIPLTMRAAWPSRILAPGSM